MYITQEEMGNVVIDVAVREVFTLQIEAVC